MNESILIIDDDISILEILEGVLITDGFSVKIITKTDDIFKIIEEYKPDLVIIDYLLQGINGGEACCQIKRNENTAHIPVILMSAYSRVLMSLGTYDCDEFIEKPFDLYYLIDRIKYHLNHSTKDIEIKI